VRTTLQKKVGGYPTELPHTGDMMMWLRFAAHGSVGFVLAAQGVYRRHSANMSSGYYANGSLRDLHQRKAALDYFYQTSGDTLPDIRRLRGISFRSLGEMAVHMATMAFNEREVHTSKQLAAFAVEVCPLIRRSPTWLKFSLKRRMGYKAWRVLQPVSTLVRSVGRPQQ
jgi:hypothetical protein